MGRRAETSGGEEAGRRGGSGVVASGEVLGQRQRWDELPTCDGARTAQVGGEDEREGVDDGVAEAATGMGAGVRGARRRGMGSSPIQIQASGGRRGRECGSWEGVGIVVRFLSGGCSGL